jgi:hypothetical protein
MALNINRNHGQNGSDNEIISETMEKKDPAINQHQSGGSGLSHSHTDHNLDTEKSSQQENNENDTNDPYFQKNAPIAQDLLGDDDNDPNRRTLDEYDANTDEPEDDELEDEDLDLDLDDDDDDAQNDKSDLQGKDFGEENDQSYTEPGFEEDDINPNIKEQDFFDPRRF